MPLVRAADAPVHRTTHFVGPTRHHGGMTIAWTTVSAPEPLGGRCLAGGGAGLVMVSFGPGQARLAAAAARLGEPLVREPARTAPAAGQLAEYLAGRRRAFELPLDWRLAGEAARPTLQCLLASVGYGATVTYGELAVRSGLGTEYTAARAVGAIMGANPLPVVVPCHRVLGTAGLGGFGGGLAVKEWLLALEGVLTPALELGLP